MLKFTPKRRLTGGLRLAAHKAESTGRSIKRGLIPPRLIVSTRQQQGSTSRPVVEIGQRVSGGETIARAESPDGTDVHAPTSGRIAAFTHCDVPLASDVSNELCIVIETDGADRSVEPTPIVAADATRVERIRLLSSAGIVGLGGAAFSTAAKLTSMSVTDCRLLIINGAECEPYISCDDMLMRESPDDILEGAAILKEITGAPECIVAIERDKPQAIDAISRAAERLAINGLKIAELPSIYPAGGERQLVEVLAGVEVPSGSYPGDFGFVCQNVGTAYAVQRYFRDGEVLSSRVVTVTGAGVANPQNVEAMIGTPVADLIAACGGYTGKPVGLIHGGSMMGFELADDTFPVTKATNCIIAPASYEVSGATREWPCIRCGECANVCPARLQPQDLVIAAREANAQSLIRLSLSECIECGCCDVVCPSHILLTQSFREAKLLVRKLLEQQAFSDASDQRFRMHEQRRHDAISKEDQQRDEIRRTLTQQEQRTEEIRAAVERARRKKTETGGG